MFFKHEALTRRDV